MRVTDIKKPYFIQVLLATMSLLSYCLPLQAQSGQRFKQINYNYDLISGKVNEVHYQASQPDAFYHKYEYDADNRITKVYTSKDNIIWDQDASYTYYAHGPLARVELGDNKVQGMDYAYTLQGWIKGVNSNVLKAENDIGNDGLSGSAHSRVAKDAFGYTLNYHAVDYKPIDATKWSNPARRFEALTPPNSDLMAARFDLYNGNISSMVTTIVEPKVYTGAANEVPNILPQGTAYQYDQLNRLLEMKAFQNLDIAANKWKQGSTYAGLYHNVFEYDANGNILYQERAGRNGLAFDKLTYQYKTVVGGGRLQNRLYHVNDGNTDATLATDDIEDQGNFTPSPNINDVNNYRYDEIGNLKYDAKEGIAKIEWTVYGKIKSITRTAVSLRSDLEFQYDASGNRVAKIEKPRDANGVKPASEWIATYYTRDAQGNVMGIYKHQPLTVGASFKLMERNLFGSSRLGSDYSEVELINALPVANPLIRVLGNKHFEGSNHLGNVLAVASDRKIPRDDDGDGVIEYFQAEVLSANDYSPFGVVLDGRSFGISDRYGFNGKEKDDEVKGEGNSLDFGARVYDSRLGRWLALDPSMKKYPSISPYNFSLNSPLLFYDPDGKDARVTVQKNPEGGGKIIIASTIFITGIAANDFNAREYTKQAAKLYAPGSYTNEKGEKYEVVFDVKFEYAPDESKIQKQDGDNILRYNQDNVISNVKSKLSAEQDENGNISNVTKTAGNEGTIGKGDAIGKSFKTSIHEALHFLGLSDRYSDSVDEDGNRVSTPDKGFEDDLLGPREGTKLNQVHYDNYGKEFSEKAAGTYILKNSVDIKKSDGSLRGGSSDGARPPKFQKK